MLIVIESNNASLNVLIGLRMLMWGTSELFHVKRIMNVVIRTTSTNVSISSIISSRFLDFTISLIIYYSAIFFSDDNI